MSVDHPHSLGAVLKCALFLIFFTVGISSYAQSYNNWSESNRTGGATQSSSSVMQGGTSRAAYQGTVYEPFNDTPPSESATDGPSKISSRQNSWGGSGMGDQTGDDAGHRDPNSPIGEAWVMLLFAAAAAVITYRKRISAQKNS